MSTPQFPQQLHVSVRLGRYNPPPRRGIPAWPSREEYDRVIRVAASNFARTTEQLGKDMVLGKTRDAQLWQYAKQAWCYFYALNEFNPDLFEGNILTQQQFWFIAEQVANMRKACGVGGTHWQNWS